jgi:hypothetical protein
MGDPQHLYAVTMGVTVEPMAPGHGVDVQITAESSGVPLHVYGNIDGFRRAVLGYLREPLSSGPRGWRLTDVRVTVTESGYSPAGPPAADVRHTTALVVAAAVRAAGTVVCEPVDRIRVEFPGTSWRGPRSADHRRWLRRGVRNCAHRRRRRGTPRTAGGRSRPSRLRSPPDHFAPARSGEGAAGR